MSDSPNPNDPQFFEAGLDIHALDDLNFENRPTVLERLGPAHFRSKGFSFMGFLQTVYDHVAEQARANTAPPADVMVESAPQAVSPAVPPSHESTAQESTAEDAAAHDSTATEPTP
ncbi:MAG: hypothetical protein ACTHLN_09455 [Tepidisphaeraceae bacterium]